MQTALRSRKESSLLAPGLALLGFEDNNLTTGKPPGPDQNSSGDDEFCGSLVEFHAGKANGKKMVKALANVVALEKGLGSIMCDHFKAHVVPVGAGETAALIADQAAAQFERLWRVRRGAQSQGIKVELPIVPSPLRSPFRDQLRRLAAPLAIP